MKKPLALPPETMLLQDLQYFFHSQAGFSQDIFQGSLGNLFVVRNSQSSVGWILVAKDYVTASSMVL